MEFGNEEGTAAQRAAATAELNSATHEPFRAFPFLILGLFMVKSTA
jgi:hypothetical protein